MAEPESQEQPPAEPVMGENVSQTCAQHAEQQLPPPIQSSHPVERPQELPSQSGPSTEEGERQQKSHPHITDWIIAGATVAMLLVTGINVYVASEQWEAMEIQADISKQQLLASRRPWVSVKVEMVGGWKYGSIIKAKYTMKNIGATPAIGVRIIPSAILRPFGDESFGDENLTAKQRELCSRGKMEVFGFGAPVLFPQEVWSEEIETGLDKAAITKHLKDNPPPSGFPPDFGFPYLLGCATYRFAFDDAPVHQTPYVYAMSRTKPKYVADSDSVTLDFVPVSSTEIFLDQVILKGAPIPD